jgi:diacylglycerol kinase family enzyme
MDRPWVAIQRNPTSGAAAQRRPILELIRQLRAHGLRPCVFRDRAMLRRWLDDPRRRESLVCLVAVGGDGTVGDVLNRCPGLPVAVLPAGTENLLSRYLRIGPSGKAVGEMIADGLRRTYDLGLLDATIEPGSLARLTRRFSVMASVGFDAEVIRLAHAARRGHITRLAYVHHIARAAVSYRYPRLRVWVDDEPEPREGRLVVAMNLPAYALGLPVARSASGHDGLLDLRIFRNGSTWSMLRYFTAITFGCHERLADVQSLQASRVRIESDEPAPIQCDGDPAGFTPAQIRILPSAVELYTPRDACAVGVQP